MLAGEGPNNEYSDPPAEPKKEILSLDLKIKKSKS